MKNRFNCRNICIIICAVLVFSLLSKPVYSLSSEISERKIIVFKSNLLNDASKDDIIKKYGGG